MTSRAVLHAAYAGMLSAILLTLALAFPVQFCWAIILLIGAGTLVVFYALYESAVERRYARDERDVDFHV